MSEHPSLEILPLWPSQPELTASLTRLPRPDSRPRPAMLVVPGGGYSCVCRATEGLPIAERFYALGFQTFILDYRVAPHRFPEPQQDILRAIKLIRAHATDWNVLPDNIAAVGFSAGGHLVASAGILHGEIDANAGDQADNVSGRPDATILCYAVISAHEGEGHGGSFECLLGDQLDAQREAISLHQRVTADTPPAFVWHTTTDQLVPWLNSVLYADALRRHGVPCSEHIFPCGQHGMQLGYGRDELSHWPEDVRRFLADTCHFRFPRRHDDRRTIILTFDDACLSHLDVAAPALLSHGFGATFFITRFPDEWRQLHNDYLLSGPQIRKLHQMGFEIGNHTWSHPDLTTLTEDEVAGEIESLNRFLLDNGIPLPTSFAYPGGPYPGPERAMVVSLHGMKYARTVERRAWHPETDDPLRLPAIPLCGPDTTPFKEAAELAEPGHPVVIVFHGVPDPVHAHCHTPSEAFLEFLDYLDRQRFNVCSFRDYDAI